MTIRWLAVLVLLTAPLASGAATLSINLDQPSYDPGDTITMTIVGDSEGAIANFGFGQLDYSATAVLAPSAVRAVPPTGTSNTWLLGNPAGACAATNCFIINMISQPIASVSGVDPAFEPFVYGTLTATAGAPGIYPITWHTGSDGFELFFFGITNAPGATLIITPEPTTAALLALGLTALVCGRMRRRS